MVVIVGELGSKKVVASFWFERCGGCGVSFWFESVQMQVRRGARRLVCMLSEHGLIARWFESRCCSNKAWSKVCTFWFDKVPDRGFYSWWGWMIRLAVAFWFMWKLNCKLKVYGSWVIIESTSCSLTMKRWVSIVCLVACSSSCGVKALASLLRT